MAATTEKDFDRLTQVQKQQLTKQQRGNGKLIKQKSPVSNAVVIHTFADITLFLTFP
ncbi:MAG: hypothetical protein ACJ72C_02640 [Nitrososphaeraceae archaeon]